MRNDSLSSQANLSQECQTDWDMAALHNLEGDPLALQVPILSLSMKSFDNMGVLTALLYLYLLSVNHLQYYTTETNKAFFLAH